MIIDGKFKVLRCWISFWFYVFIKKNKLDFVKIGCAVNSWLSFSVYLRNFFVTPKILLKIKRWHLENFIRKANFRSTFFLFGKIVHRFFFKPSNLSFPMFFYLCRTLSFVKFSIYLPHSCYRAKVLLLSTGLCIWYSVP